LQTVEIVCNTRESNGSECSVGLHEDDGYGYTLRESIFGTKSALDVTFDTFRIVLNNDAF